LANDFSFSVLVCIDGQWLPRQQPYLPDEILWRQKEQFSDGVGYSWIDGLKAHAESVVSDTAFQAVAQRWPVDTPDTKEGYFIRDIFDSACSTILVLYLHLAERRLDSW
jgi:asparagine synthetase B (glutamine-hydrolysing)